MCVHWLLSERFIKTQSVVQAIIREQSEQPITYTQTRAKTLLPLHSAVGNKKRVPNSELVSNTCCKQSFNPAVIDSWAFILIESWKQYAYFYKADVIISFHCYEGKVCSTFLSQLLSTSHRRGWWWMCLHLSCPVLNKEMFKARAQQSIHVDQATLCILVMFTWCIDLEKSTNTHVECSNVWKLLNNTTSVMSSLMWFKMLVLVS